MIAHSSIVDEQIFDAHFMTYITSHHLNNYYAMPPELIARPQQCSIKKSEGYPIQKEIKLLFQSFTSNTVKYV